MPLPALQGAKFNARDFVCTGHLKQWGLGFLQYAGDFDGYLPSFRGAAAWYLSEMVTPVFQNSMANYGLRPEGSTSIPHGEERQLDCPFAPMYGKPWRDGQNASDSLLFVFYGYSVWIPRAWNNGHAWFPPDRTAPGEMAGPSRVDGECHDKPMMTDTLIDSANFGGVPTPWPWAYAWHKRGGTGSTQLPPW